MRIVPLHLTQRMKRARLINDIYPGIMVVVAGVTMLQSGQWNLFAFANIAVGVLLIRFGVKEWRSSPGEESHGIQWFDVLGGAVTALDAFAIYKPWKGFQPAWLYFFASLIIMAKGMFASKIPNRRRLTIFEDGFKIRRSPFSVFRCSWADVQTISFDGPTLQVITNNNMRRSFKLRAIENVSEAIEALKEAARNNRVDVSEGTIV